MAVKIQLKKPTQGPTPAISTAKPSLALADTSGEQAVAEAFGDVANKQFADLVKARATNEEAQFQGEVKTAQQEFDTYVATNPGDSFEEVKIQRDKMLEDIKKAGGNATTKIAQTNNANWFTANFEVLKEQTETSMVATRTRQELSTADDIADGFKNNLDKEGLAIFTQQQIANGLWEETGAKARLQNEFDVIDAAQSKIDVQNASQVGFDAWEDTVTEATPDGDLNAGFDIIDSIPGLTGDQKQNAESAMKTRVSNRRAEDKVQLEEANVQANEDVKGRLNKREFDGIAAFINSRPVPESVRFELQRTANSFISSINSAKASTVTSLETNIAIDRLVRSVRSGDVTYDEGIDSYQKLAPDINSAENEQNLDSISTAANQAQSADDRRKNGKYTTRLRQLKDSIERQTSLLLEPDEIDEVLVDLSNRAELELADKFSGIEYEDDELTTEVDRLMRKYTLSQAQMTRAVTARQLRLAESFEEQQKAITDSIRQLTAEGKRSEAKAVMEDAIALGFDLTPEGKAKPKEVKKKKSGVGVIINRLLRRD
jgi:hypothetical protein